MERTPWPKIAYLGCGPEPKKGRINVDIRQLPGVNVVADVKALPFADGELDGIESRNLIEHFDRFEIGPLVKEWHRTLKPGGTITFETVDMGLAMDKWRQIPWDNLLDCMYGAQTYPENYHKMLMTEEYLMNLFQSIGMLYVSSEKFEHREIPRIKMTFLK